MGIVLGNGHWNGLMVTNVLNVFKSYVSRLRERFHSGWLVSSISPFNLPTQLLPLFSYLYLFDIVSQVVQTKLSKTNVFPFQAITP